jgi:hypothetical protein
MLTTKQATTNRGSWQRWRRLRDIVIVIYIDEGDSALTVVNSTLKTHLCT